MVEIRPVTVFDGSLIEDLLAQEATDPSDHETAECLTTAESMTYESELARVFAEELEHGDTLELAAKLQALAVGVLGAFTLLAGISFGLLWNIYGLNALTSIRRFFIR